MKKNELIKIAQDNLKRCSIPDFEESSRILLQFILQKDSVELLKIDDIDEQNVSKYLSAIKKRCKHIPLEKIIGYKYFYDIKIPFHKNVLTPRFETEFLVDRLVMDIKNDYSQVRLNSPFSPISVLDMCTGSGCIGIALANATGVNVTLSDLSRSALQIAKKNNKLNNEIREKNGLPPLKLNFVLSNMFKSIKWKFDYIVCNPPYICTTDLNKLEIEVRDFDPLLALDGGKDGLDFYKIIANEAHKFLNESGKIYLEIGIKQSEKIVKLLQKNFENIQVIKDLAGRDRFIIAKKRDKYAK